MKKRHHIPNLLSASRFVLCLPLCWAEALTHPFWMLYLLIGVTDILDGFLARRWNAASTFGAKLDSWADLAFAITVAYKLFPWLKALPVSLWIMIGIIALVKLVNVISSLVVLHKVVFLHTLANKITGVLVFIGLLAISQPYFIYAAWAIACVALFAAVQEGHWIRRGKAKVGSVCVH